MLREHLVLDGVRFMGCTLWTDFLLPARQPGGRSEVDLGLALLDTELRMNDYRRIELPLPLRSQPRGRTPLRPRQPEDMLAMHWVDRDWLRRQLQESCDGPTVVVTHHAPTLASVAQRYAEDWLTPSFVGALPGDFFEVPRLGVQGHTHSPLDYMAGRCRVGSNLRDYRPGSGRFENPPFDRGWVVEVSASASGDHKDDVEGGDVLSVPGL